jgi:hypothetical protein
MYVNNDVLHVIILIILITNIMLVWKHLSPRRIELKGIINSETLFYRSFKSFKTLM